MALRMLAVLADDDNYWASSALEFDKSHSFEEPEMPHEVGLDSSE